MKKLFALIAVLSLIAGTAYAADLNDGLTRQVWAQTKGRSVVSDSSVVMRVWYTGSTAVRVGASSGTVEIYTGATAETNTSVSNVTYYTIQNAVDYINSLTDWHAAVGPDTFGGDVYGNGALNSLVVQNLATPGSTKQTAISIKRDSGAGRRLGAGIEATDGKFNRIKSVVAKYAANTTGGITSILIYDGDTVVYRKDIAGTPAMGVNLATNKDASPTTVTFMDYTDKGIASGYGKSLVAVVSTNSAVSNDIALGDTAGKIAEHNITITYDQF